MKLSRLAGLLSLGNLIACSAVGLPVKAGPSATKVATTLTITQGGIYSGTYASDSATVPAVEVMTDEPVILENMNLRSRGDLIWISGVSTGAQVTVHNVTGTALDPGIYGYERGRFILASHTDKLVATNNTIHGASFGVLAGGNDISQFVFTGNTIDGMEDRASDGAGGFLTSRPSLGHFVNIERASFPNGAEIAWNQMVDEIGTTSVEDAINLYNVAGTEANPILVHDNYLQGGSSAAVPDHYTGDGIITDGPGNDGGPPVGWVSIYGNHIVHTAGGGVFFASGHDVTAQNNTVVSCGRDRRGKWFAMPFTNAIGIYDEYGMPGFGNNLITSTHGGLVRPDGDGNPQVADIDQSAPPATFDSTIQNNLFTDPCLVDGQLTLEPEREEFRRWERKLRSAGIELGDTR